MLASGTLNIRVLGPVVVEREGTPVDVGPSRRRAMLGLLALTHGRSLSRLDLMDGLWPGRPPPPSAVNVIHTHVKHLRRVLEPDRLPRARGTVLRQVGDGYVLDVPALAVDVGRFRDRVAAARSAEQLHRPELAAELLAEALGWWRGAPVADLPALATHPKVVALVSERRVALARYGDVAIASGRAAEALPLLAEAAAEQLLDESGYVRLIRAYRAVGWRTKAFAAYHEIRARLAEELGVDPGPDLSAAHLELLHDTPLPAAPPAVVARQAPAGPGSRPPGELPAYVTSFVGRQRDLAAVATMLRTDRLVTLTGVGGVGKSRLGVEVARAEAPDGTHLIGMATLSQPGLVATTLAAGLGLCEHPHRQPVDQIVERVADSAVLLVLDDCERVVAEVAELADRLLSACARLRILVTSRERLGVPGERLWPVTGLGVPRPDADLDAIGRADAVRLLVARAAAVQPGFELTGANGATVAGICRRLDGLPLALELTAAGMNALGIEQIAACLADHVDLPTGGVRTALPRHRTLRAVADWSYELLDVAQRWLFDRLCVFVGGFTLDAATAVCADPAGAGPSVAERLVRLVDKSLVVTDHADTAAPRYRIPESLRAFGLERLDRSGLIAELRDRHAAYMWRMVRASRREPRPLSLRLESEHDNFRAALDWSVARADSATAVRLAGSLYPLWDQRGHYREGRQWLGRALALPAAAEPVVRARALHSAAGLAIFQGDFPQALAHLTEAAALSRRARDRAGLTGVLATSGLATIYAGSPERAIPLLEEALRHARDGGRPSVLGPAMLYLATAALTLGDYDRARTVGADCATVFTAEGDPEGWAGAQALRAAAASRVGDRIPAARHLRDSMHGFHRLGHRWGLSTCLVIAADMACADDDHARAVALVGAAEAIRRAIGTAPIPFAKVWMDAVVARARTRLDRVRFDREWRAGQEMPPEHAIALAGGP